MGVFDKENLFCTDMDGQDITATARAAVSIDLGAKGVSKGERMVEVICQVIADFDSGADDGTLVVALVTDSALPMDGSSIVLHQTAAILEAVLVAGYQFSLGMVPIGALQYLDLLYTVAGSGNFTAGTIIAGLNLDRQTNE